MTTSERRSQLFDKVTAAFSRSPRRLCASGRGKQKHLEGFLHISMSRRASLQQR